MTSCHSPGNGQILNGSVKRARTLADVTKVERSSICYVLPFHPQEAIQLAQANQSPGPCP